MTKKKRLEDFGCSKKKGFSKVQALVKNSVPQTFLPRETLDT